MNTNYPKKFLEKSFAHDDINDIIVGYDIFPNMISVLLRVTNLRLRKVILHPGTQKYIF